ncbi:MAG TPA: NHL repeat-containing protein [Verrucomicrobiae bacterium]|nr:NHL repeat-containing protein [Verrucomicrobiae bacterium]
MRIFFHALGFAAIFAGLAGCAGSQTSAQTEATPRPPLAFISSWGVKGSDPGQLEDPFNLATDAVGNVFLADGGSGYIDKFDSAGTPLLSFQQSGLKHPQWIAVDSGGAIYVSDPVRASVFVFLPDGDKYRELRVRARPSEDNLLSVAVNDDGTVYVLDGSTGRVSQFNSRLRFARSWLVPGISRGGGALAGPIEAAKDGSLYVADPGSGLIRHLTSEGGSEGEIGPPATGGKLGGRFAVSSNAIFAMDADGRMLHIFSLDGALKSSIDLAPQLGQGSRDAPAVAASPRQELLVLDNSATRILRYRIQF